MNNLLEILADFHLKGFDRASFALSVIVPSMTHGVFIDFD